MSDLDFNLIHRFNVGDALRRSAARYPQQRAIHFLGRELTYAELEALANRMARKLMACGVGRGEVRHRDGSAPIASGRSCGASDGRSEGGPS